MLGELAELGLMLARDLAVQARAAEDAEEKVALSAAFQKTSRGVRLTLALDFQLERQAARAEREAELQAREDLASQERAARLADSSAGPADLPPAERQKARVRGVLKRLLWTKAEGDEESSTSSSKTSTPAWTKPRRLRASPTSPSRRWPSA